MAEKEKKYDRQLRLWGDHGQRDLENASVCLINVTATGTETLKNLILPGIGSFTIVDGGRISGQDAGNNFFLDPEKIGEYKSKVAMELLQELNPDVKGEYVEEDVSQLLERTPQFFTGFSVVISGSLTLTVLKKLAALLWPHKVPLVVCLSYGFLGYIRIAVEEHAVIESHPDNAHEDLRLDDPIEDFVKFCDSIDLESLDKKDHSHTPYLIILFKYLQTWKNDHNGQVPNTWKEKKQFKAAILAGVRKNAEGVPEDEENYDEAAKHVNTAFVPNKIPPELKAILDDHKCLNITDSSSNFWILANGLRQFVQNEGCGFLPLRGSLPDMTSDSERYVKLQNIYQAKAAHDMQIVSNYVSQACSSLGCGNGRVSERDLKRFCRNAHFLRVLRTRSLEEEYKQPSKAVIDEFTSDSNSDALWYVLWRAVEMFYTTHGKYPGIEDEELEMDVSRMKSFVKDLMKSWGIPGAIEAVSDDSLQEICRCGAAEIHSVAAYMGGVAAQECIKLITGQYVPVSGAYIYNGLKSTSLTLAV
uniref:NEDD8-activating enzyme E1 regulatory subunit n=1 Tax=Phallusia mammillata TaxID=59560 RepID=A0A6F9DM29_9ASCI|nr:NEDD8-activating enzyme E1 regulatory subunit-like [Phallusia mammillata]